MTIEGLAQGDGELRGPIVIEQVKELNGEPGGRFPPLEGGLKKDAAFRDQRGQTTGGRRPQSLAFLLEQGVAVTCRNDDDF